MTALRLDAFAAYERMSMPAWCRTILGKKFDPARLHQRGTAEIPDSICAFGACATPPEECPAAGILMHQDSQTPYARLQKEWQEQGVIFTDMASALQNHPELVKRYLGSVVNYEENVFTALTAAAWRVGSFIYVPANVQLAMPLQAYYRIASQLFGQFERTLIVAEQGSSLCYLEGCGSSEGMGGAAHYGMVEVIAQSRAQVRFITMQHWGFDVVSCATKRAVAHENAKVVWVDGTFGGKVTLKYPTIELKGAGACGQIISSTVAMQGQHHDTGGNIMCQAPDTRGSIDAKTLCMPQGKSGSRSKVIIEPGAARAHVTMRCDALLAHDAVFMAALPSIEVNEGSASVAHEAQIASFEDEQLFYCQSRGIAAESAQTLMALGFLDAFVQELPAEYAVEVARMLMPAMKGVHAV